MEAEQVKKQKKLNDNENNQEKLIEYYFSTKHTKFFHLLRITEKWKETYKSNAGKISLLISILLVFVWRYLFNSVDIEIFNQIIRDITTNIFGALIGMLGFIISGLAILTGTVNDKLIDIIDKKRMSVHIISILYSFYFIGAFIGVSILMFVGMYLMSFPDIIATNVRVAVISFALSYMFCFSIFYSIALLGTCLRIFIVSYKFIKDDKEKNKITNK